MRIPASIQQILNDNVSGSETLLKRLIIVLENELLDPDLETETFIAYLEHLRYKMKANTFIYAFCDEFILFHNISADHYPANYLEFMRKYMEKI